MCGLPWLSPFTQQHVFKACPCWSSCQQFVPFYCPVIFHCMARWHFVCPFLSGWTLGCLHFRVIMRSAAADICELSFCVDVFLFFPGYVPRSRIVGWNVTPFKHFEELLNCFSKQLHHFTILLAMWQGSNLATSWSTLVTGCHFDYSHPTRCEMGPHYGLYLVFLMTNT